jgi:hypothetical protein
MGDSGMGLGARGDPQAIDRIGAVGPCNAPATRNVRLTRALPLPSGTIGAAPGDATYPMDSDLSLRRLLDELQVADVARQGTPRDTPAYTEAVDRDERLVRAVWDAVGDEPVRHPGDNAGGLADEARNL